jgi:peptidoglycan/LPS O-acetylase OafA/YrhL
MIYRREVDGLRAVAVLPVILFHAGASFLSGGFVGVDVFFVISGYLITAILREDIGQGRFSYLDFYERRARRLLPALFVVLLCTCLAAAFLLLPQDTESLAQSVMAVTLFGSNILFWRQSGYFDTAAELKPLLHTWSLSVEEQFYLLFPPVLMLLKGRSQASLRLSLIVLGLVSLAVSEWAIQRSASAAYFLLPSRAWELLIGAWVATQYKPQAATQGHGPVTRLAIEAAGMGGILTLAWCVVSYSSQTPFPGLHALAPTLATAAILLWARPDTLAGKALGWQPLVFIGTLSYSAYLWHQPLLAMARLRSTAPLNEHLWPLWLGLTLALAYASWRWVEQPFRNRARFQRNTIFKFTLVGSLSFMAISATAIYSQGLRFRYPAPLSEPPKFDWATHVRQGTCHIQRAVGAKRPASCFTDLSHEMVVWGDSHAAALYPGLAEVSQSHSGWGITQLTQAGCGPLFALTDLRYQKDCNQINLAVMQRLRDHPPQVLIIHAAWQHFHYPLSDAELDRKLDDTLGQVTQALPSGTHVVVIGPMPRWKTSPQGDAMREHFMQTIDGASLTFPMRLEADRMKDLDARLAQVTRKHHITYLSPSAALCNDQGCLAKLGPQAEAWTAIDYGHLSAMGARHYAEAVWPVLVEPKR